MPKPARPPAAIPKPTVGDTADIVAQFTGELAALAKQARLDLLAYLLEMAHLEAIRNGVEGRTNDVRGGPLEALPLPSSGCE